MPPPVAGRLPDVVLDAGCIAPCTRSACCRCSTALELQRLVDLAAMARARAPLRYHCGTGVASSGVPPQSTSEGGRRSPQGSRDDDVLFPATRVK